MSLFESITNEVLFEKPELSIFRPVIEKELLHQEILRTMSDSGFLENLTFIGGTCLRSCFGSRRLSEDLDFTGGVDFDAKSMADFPHNLQKRLEQKYKFPIHISNPVKEKAVPGHVDTWKIKIETYPNRPNLPTQKIHLDICSISSYTRKLRSFINHYKVDLGGQSLILFCESEEEIFIDKFLAIALRPNRVKYRDIWDIHWLHNQNISPNYDLLLPKLQERNIATEDFLQNFKSRIKTLSENTALESEFYAELNRFIAFEKKDPLFFRYITTILDDYAKKFAAFL